MMKTITYWTIAVLLFLLLTAMRGNDGDSDSPGQEKTSEKSGLAQELLTHKKGHTHSTSIQQQYKYQNKSIHSSPTPKSGIRDNVMLTEERPDGNVRISFEVIDLSNKDAGEVMKELLTHQAEGKFYFRKVEAEGGINRERLAAAFKALLKDMNIEELSQQKWQELKKSLFSEQPVVMNESSDNKPLKYRITASGDYEYYDGHEIVGGKKYKKRFENGYKPLAKLVFYYEVRDKGLLKKDIGPREFLSLSIEKQRAIVKDEPIYESSVR